MATVTINGIDIEETYSLTWYDIKKDDVEPNLEQVEIPGANGVVDLTEANGKQITYQNFEMTLAFYEVDKSINTFLAKDSALKTAFNGQTVKVVLPDDANSYYTGRCVIKSDKKDFDNSVYEFVIDCNPIRYQTELTEQTATASVNGTTVTCENSFAPATPTINVLNATTSVKFNGTEMSLLQGDNVFPEIVFLQGDNQLIFYGIATDEITITWQEGAL